MESPRRGRMWRGGPPASLGLLLPSPFSNPPPDPRPWGVSTEAASSGSPPATSLVAFQGSVDSELNPSLSFCHLPPVWPGLPYQNSPVKWKEYYILLLWESNTMCVCGLGHSDKGVYSQSYGFSGSHVQMWGLDHKAGLAPKTWCFQTVVLEKTLESHLDCKEIKPVHPKGDQSCIFIERTDAEAEAPILWLPDGKSWLIWKDPDAGKVWR